MSKNKQAASTIQDVVKQIKSLPVPGQDAAAWESEVRRITGALTDIAKVLSDARDDMDEEARRRMLTQTVYEAEKIIGGLQRFAENHLLRSRVAQRADARFAELTKKEIAWAENLKMKAVPLAKTVSGTIKLLES